MKRIIQVILLLVLIASMVIFYNLYLKEESKTEIKKQISTNQTEDNTNQMGDNNLDPRILKKNNLWWKHKDKSYNYWATYALGIEWVKSVNAKSIEEICIS